MKLHPSLFCIMIYQSLFPASWLTQILLNIDGDVKSNPRPSQMCSMPVHMKFGTSVHVPNDMSVKVSKTLPILKVLSSTKRGDIALNMLSLTRPILEIAPLYDHLLDPQ